MLAFACLYTFALIARGFPPQWEFQQRLGSAFDFWFESLQFWQCWKMFAPDPPTYNYRLQAKVTFNDGSTQTIHWPWFPAMSRWERFKHARMGKWMENTVGDYFRSSWPSVTVFVAKVASCDEKHRSNLVDIWEDLPRYVQSSSLCPLEKSPVRVELFRNWEDITPPEYRFLAIPPKPTGWQPMWTYFVEPGDYTKWGS